MLQRNLSYAWHAGLDELAARFRTSLLGGLWLIIGPLLMMAVYWIVFDKVVGVQFADPRTREEVPFLAPFAVGFFLYLTFSEIAGGAANWFRSKRRLLTESELPPWTIFMILIVRSAAQFACYMLVAVAIAAAYGLTTPTGALLFLLAAIPVFVIFSGVGLVIGLLGAFFGDVREIMPVLLRVIFYASSITFPLTAIPEALRWIPLANPLTWAVELTRSVLLWDSAAAPSFLLGLAGLGVAAWALAILFYWRLAAVLDQVI